MKRVSSQRVWPCSVEHRGAAMGVENFKMCMTNDFTDAGLVPPSQEQIENRDWEGIVEAQTPFRRFDAFALLGEHLQPQELAILFGFTWVHSEGSFSVEQIEFIFDDFARRGITRDMLMSEAERIGFDALPDPFLIFRGCQESTRLGISWSLSPEVALTFAHRAADENEENHTGIVVRAQCAKDAVRAYFNSDLAELEVIVDSTRIAPENAPIQTVAGEGSSNDLS